MKKQFLFPFAFATLLASTTAASAQQITGISNPVLTALGPTNNPNCNQTGSWLTGYSTTATGVKLTFNSACAIDLGMKAHFDLSVLGGTFGSQTFAGCLMPAFGYTHENCYEGGYFGYNGSYNSWHWQGPLLDTVHPGKEWSAEYGYEADIYDGGLDIYYGNPGSSVGTVAVEIYIDEVNLAPEPASIVLVGTGLLGVVAIARRRRVRIVDC